MLRDRFGRGPRRLTQRRVFLQQVSSAPGILALLGRSAGQAPSTVDVLVWDSTPAGIAAAIAAAREGRSACIVTEDKHVGGMQTSGLGNTNAGRRATIGGLTREFHDRIRKYYLEQYGAGSDQAAACQDGFRFEPHVAEEAYVRWLSEAGVECLTEESIVSVEKEGSRVRSVRTERGRIFRAAVFIDASYEGDLIKLAGCSYRVGREASAEYGESLAGVRFPPEQAGKGDNKVQAYDYRLCLTDVADNQVSFRRPANYAPSNYAFQAARMKHAPPSMLREVLPVNPMPNRKTDSRTGEWVGASWDYPEADRARRKEIETMHRDYSAGYIWFLLHDAPVPAHIRDELTKWGLAKDEFTDNENWPYHIYVREARRLLGDFVMTQRDVMQDRFKQDGVAIGSFFLDVHPVQMVVTSDAVVAEGSLGNVRVKPYEIPYRSLLPRAAEAENLLAPVCVSASHIAFSTIRMEPVYMMLGHASGVAAAMSLSDSIPLHRMPVSKLRARLAEQGQILDASQFTDVWPD